MFSTFDHWIGVQKEEEATKFGCRDAFRHYGSSHLRAMTEGSSQHALTHLGRRLPTADGRRRATNPSDPGTEWLPHCCSHRILRRRRRKRTYGKMSCQILGENNRTMRNEKNTWSLNQQSLKTEDSEQCMHCLLCPQFDPLRLPLLFSFWHIHVTIREQGSNKASSSSRSPTRFACTYTATARSVAFLWSTPFQSYLVVT